MKSIKITFTGDIMLNQALLKQKKYNNIFSDVEYFLKKADFVISNLETPITNNIISFADDIYRFASPLEFAKAVKYSGVNLVTTANNHCLDNGISGAKETVELLNSINLYNTGISYNNEKNYIIKKVGDINIGIISYTYGTNAFNNNVYLNKSAKVKINLFQNQELSNRLIRKLYFSKNIFVRILRLIFRKFGLFQLNKPIYERKEKSRINDVKSTIKRCKSDGADYIVMCIHMGGQYNKFPLKQCKKLVKCMQKYGVDLIVGNHEHIVQQVEISNNKLAAYCLGNFVSATGVLNKPFDKMADYSILLNVYLDEQANEIKRTFTIVKIVKVEVNNTESIKVKLLCDLINDTQNELLKKQLMSDNNYITKTVLNNEIYKDIILKEYDILNEETKI